MSKKILVVDLDGTLYNLNTFHKFLKYLLSFYVRNFNLIKLNYLVFFIKLRFLKLISHAKLKYHVLKLIENEKINFEDFVVSLQDYKNEIEEVSNANFDIKILATAAPSYYAEIIAKHHNFDICLATDFPKNGFFSDFENLGKRKKESVLLYLNSINEKNINVFITDHIDDAPLIRLASQNIIINPNASFVKWLKENLINFEIRKVI